MKKIRLTEREAWKYIAERWEARLKEPVRNCTFYITMYNNKYGVYLHCLGLCSCIELLMDGLQITKRQHDNMKRKIDKFKNQYKTRLGYVWVINEAGAKARAAFCRAMANRKPYTSKDGMWNAD